MNKENKYYVEVLSAKFTTNRTNWEIMKANKMS